MVSEVGRQTGGTVQLRLREGDVILHFEECRLDAARVRVANITLCRSRTFFVREGAAVAVPLCAGVTMLAIKCRGGYVRVCLELTDGSEVYG